MNLRIQNQLHMVGTCITVATSTENQPVWDGKEPAAFGDDFFALAAAYATTAEKHALAKAATGGAGDAKALAETILEDRAHAIARALANHFKKTGDPDRRGKIDFTKSAIVKLRQRDLLDQATAIRNIALTAVAEPAADTRGITNDRIATLTAAISVFSDILDTPRGQIVNRSTLLKEVETDTAALLEQLADLDDLILQFEPTESAQRFIHAWKNARNIVDAGHRHDPPTAEDPPAPAP